MLETGLFVHQNKTINFPLFTLQPYNIASTGLTSAGFVPNMYNPYFQCCLIEPLDYACNYSWPAFQVTTPSNFYDMRCFTNTPQISNSINKTFQNRHELSIINHDSLNLVPKRHLKRKAVFAIHKEIQPIGKLDQNCSTYIHRNICKSIIRNIKSYIKKKKNLIKEVLQSEGFTAKEINDSINLAKDLKPYECTKTYEEIVNEIIEIITPITYILKETLGELFKNWDDGNYGRIASHNFDKYKEICTGYFNRVIQSLVKKQSSN